MLPKTKPKCLWTFVKIGTYCFLFVYGVAYGLVKKQW